MTTRKRRRSRINYQQRFDQYLNQYRRRFRFRNLAVTIAAMLFAAVTITLFTAVLGDTLAYSSWLYYPARLILAIAAIAIVVFFFVKPTRKIKQADGAIEIESAVPALNGRAETYLDLKRREANSPFVALLARDASRKAATAPVRTLLPTAEIIGPVIAGGGMLLLLAWLFTAMPMQWRAGMHHLWLGWFKQDILPERSIALEPGDTKIRLGDSLAVVAWLEGFDSHRAELHIRKRADDDTTTSWETIDMNRRQDGSFAFTMYGISDPLDYYVSSAFTKSEQAGVDVVVPARIESLQLTYRYPAWTKREPRVVSNGGNIAAVAGTTVDLLIETDKPLSDGELLIDKVAGKLIIEDELTYRASLSVTADNTTYQLADLFGDDRIMLTQEYSITVTDDASPTISFTLPAGDHNATAIEEVTVMATAADDFEVSDVLLHYSLNGGEWTSVALSAEDDYRHVFMLEEFTSEFNEPLIPGDLLTYYAEARDREQSTSTDIQFIDIRPFERRYTQSQQSGGGGGGGQQEPPPGEISQRQREILVATWNLIKAQESAPTLNTGAGAYPARGLPRRNTPQQRILEENAALLADLQTKLADQAQKLAERAEARQLLENDPKIAQFIEYMQKAAEEMRPSADQLGTQSLQEAVRHQQRALQFLRRGELLFNDITINQNQGNGEGNSAGRDMAEIYELEMDLAKNQYETPDRVQQNANGGSSPEDDALEKLKDLAKRQQRLAEAARDDDLSMAERWEQEKLRRELEQLRRELEQLQRNDSQQNNQNQTAQNQSGSESRQGSEQNAGQQSEGQQGEGQQGEGQQGEGQQGEGQQGEGQQNAGGAGGQSGQQQAMQNLEQAIRDLQNAEADSNNPQDLQAASQRLQESLQQMQQARQQRLQDQLADAADNVRDLTEQQLDTARQLRDAMQAAIEARNRNEFSSGLTPGQQQALAEQKRQMQRELESIRQSLADAAKRFAEDAPQTSEQLLDALDQLDDTKASEMMGIAGDMIEEGLAPQASLREQRVTDALRNLQQDLTDARASAVAEAGATPAEQLTATDAARSLQTMRQALNQSLRESAQASPPPDNQQAQGGSGQQQGEQPGGQRGSGQGGGSQSAASDQTGQSPGTSSNGQPTARGQNRGSAGESTSEQNSQQQLLTEATTQLEQLANSNVEGLSEATIVDMQALAQQLRESGDSPESDRRIEADVRLLLRQLEQLELQIYRESQGITGIRSARSSKPAAGFNKRTADYFKRLSEEASGS